MKSILYNNYLRSLNMIGCRGIPLSAVNPANMISWPGKALNPSSSLLKSILIILWRFCFTRKHIVETRWQQRWEREKGWDMTHHVPVITQTHNILSTWPMSQLTKPHNNPPNPRRFSAITHYNILEVELWWIFGTAVLIDVTWHEGQTALDQQIYAQIYEYRFRWGHV